MDIFMFEKKEAAKPVEIKKEVKKVAKCKFHKVHDRHCVDCNA